MPAPKTYEIGLSKTEEQLLRRNFFGPNRGAVDSPGMTRLFKSTLELGYPQAGEKDQSTLIYKMLTSILALDQSMREAKERGTDIERCSEGLPMNMLMPDAHTRPDKFSSSAHNHGSRISSPSAEPLRVPVLSAIDVTEPFDSPPRELLTELAVDGIDPPVTTTPKKSSTSHGELPRFNRIEDIEEFLARRAEFRDRPQVPCNEAPRIHCGPAECEAFKAYYQEPASVFLNYFHMLERMPDPPMPEPSTKWQGWPHSPSAPVQNPIDAAPKPSQTDMIPIPKREEAPEMIAGVTEVAEAGKNRKGYFS